MFRRSPKHPPGHVEVKLDKVVAFVRETYNYKKSETDVARIASDLFKILDENKPPITKARFHHPLTPPAIDPDM